MMKDLNGRVAVVTGAASGIGRALAEAFVRERMSVVLADVEDRALEDTVDALRGDGGDVIGVQTDVTDPESVESLAEASYHAFGAVHVLCNNAGVGPPSAKVWDSTPNDWRWTFGVNVFGVVHGIQAFVPRMLSGGADGIVINTSSPDGPIRPMPQASVYAASKSAVTTLTECLDAQLRHDDTRLRAAVFYPAGQGLLDTGLWTSDRNRPDDLARERPRETPAMTVAGIQEAAAESGRTIPVQPLDELARSVIDGIREDRFVMILPTYEISGVLDERLDRILRGENPTDAHDLTL